MSTPILIPEHCPICAVLVYAVKQQGAGPENYQELRAHQRRHTYGFYRARCGTCEEMLTQLERWRELSDDEVLRIHHEYETHFELAHQRAGLVQQLFPGGQVTTGRKPG